MFFKNLCCKASSGVIRSIGFIFKHLFIRSIKSGFVPIKFKTSSKSKFYYGTITYVSSS